MLPPPVTELKQAAWLAPSADAYCMRENFWTVEEDEEESHDTPRGASWAALAAQVDARI